MTMKIENKVFKFDGKKRGTWLETVSSSFASRLEKNTYPLRFSIVDLKQDSMVLETTIVRFDPDSKYAHELSNVEILSPRKKAFQGAPFGVVQIVPTGIRCEMGGYAGDACPATNLLADFVHSAELDCPAGTARNTGGQFSLFQKSETQVALLHMAIRAKLWGSKAACPGTKTASNTFLRIANHNAVFCSLAYRAGRARFHAIRIAAVHATHGDVPDARIRVNTLFQGYNSPPAGTGGAGLGVNQRRQCVLLLTGDFARVTIDAAGGIK